MQNQGMMGLLNDPRMAGLMGAAGGLLSAAGPTPQKVGLGGAMGAGIGGGLAGMMGAEQYTADREMQEMMKRFMQQQMGMPGTPGIMGGAPQMGAGQPTGVPGMGMPRLAQAGMPMPLTGALR